MRLAIGIGGAAGAVARHGVSTAAAICCASALPWGTLAVNAGGSAALGLFMSTLPATTVTPATRAGLTVGFCGGFTTFSTFSLEILTLARAGHASLAAGYVIVSVLAALLAVFLGMQAGAFLTRRGRGRLRAIPPVDGRTAHGSEGTEVAPPAEDRR